MIHIQTAREIFTEIAIGRDLGGEVQREGYGKLRVEFWNGVFVSQGFHLARRHELAAS